MLMRWNKMKLPEHKAYHFLAGDVNHRQYGGTWYKKLGNSNCDIDITMNGKRFVVPVSDYHVLEMINFPDATGEQYQGHNYVGTVSYIDLCCEAWRKNIIRALDCCGWIDENTPLTETMILEAVHSYMGGDKERVDSSNNYYELLSELKRV
jgi:hypothetical protein